MRPLVLILCLSLIALPVAAIARQTPQTGEARQLQAEFRDERARARRLRQEAAEAGREIAGLERQLAGLRSAVGLRFRHARETGQLLLAAARACGPGGVAISVVAWTRRPT